ncbi:TPA: ead/Ea22-like family protein [Escherichia coli]|uniref:ead/Ea22-like family protein n=1 Tax=Escherichia coli TaxID=562 RepID=UPI000DEE6FDD|nr:ead/Ea22-like family protein [Escherichia coli]HDB9190663.1 ead/Ea22-like family protein [Escherichia coli]HDC0173661.1 ead/Ea22-like family protein [Escherichia coli]HDC4790251.1 ead/Ea22-like family protein [Escherichia coli]HDK0113500.1 ead/Ea22-like family protein [Escherichia coli]
MESNIKGLVAAGHEMASELKAECGAVDMRSVAKLISDLATQLEVQLARANALAEDQQKAIESIKQADSAVKLAHEKFSALAAENAELEKSEEQLINERDHAESALADMYFAATGDEPEWSNWFGFSDAVDAVVDRIADLEAKQPSPVVPEGLVKAVRFYEQVKRENPPVETGAWKDAVDWVLKEACQAVNIGIKGG